MKIALIIVCVLLGTVSAMLIGLIYELNKVAKAALKGFFHES